MKILIIGRKTLFSSEDVAEDYEIYQEFLKLGVETEFSEWPVILPLRIFNWIFIAKTITKKEELQEIKDKFPSAKIAYWTPDYMRITDTENGFQEMIKCVDLFIGNMTENQSWFEYNKVSYYYWPEDRASEIFRKEPNIVVTNHYGQTPYLKNECPIGFIGNWNHNPWRANILREFQYHFGEGMVHVTGASVKEFIERDNLLDVHYPVYGHLFNALVDITKINLSMESMGNRGYWGPRTSRIMAAGGFVLAWHCLGMEKTFGSNYENLVYFHSVNEGISAAEYYLKNEDERKAIAERGYEFANKNLRPANRVKELLVCLEKKSLSATPPI